MSRNWIAVGVAAICFITGAALSHVIEPGVRVETIMLTTNTPALRLFPATPGRHPIALLAHGNGGSVTINNECAGCHFSLVRTHP